MKQEDKTIEYLLLEFCRNRISLQFQHHTTIQRLVITGYNGSTYADRAIFLPEMFQELKPEVYLADQLEALLTDFQDAFIKDVVFDEEPPQNLWRDIESKEKEMVKDVNTNWRHFGQKPAYMEPQESPSTSDMQKPLMVCANCRIPMTRDKALNVIQERIYCDVCVNQICARCGVPENLLTKWQKFGTKKYCDLCLADYNAKAAALMAKQ